MIPQVAIDGFLNQPREDHRWLKKLNHSRLDKAITALNPLPNLHPDFDLHQKVGFLLGVAYPKFAFWYDMGTGKTLLSLSLLQYWWDCNILDRAVILVRSEKAFLTWETQIRRWGISIPFILIGNSSTNEKWVQFESFDKGLIVLTYPGMVRMLTRSVKAKKGSKSNLKLDDNLLERFTAGLQALVLDESTKAGHRDSLISQACVKISDSVKFCYELAGRPFGRDPMLLWAQYYILDKGETFGETLGLFRSAFYNEDTNPYGNKYSKEYTFKKNMRSELMRIAQHRSISYAAEECIDLPDFQSIVEEVGLPEEAEAYYQRIVQQVIAAKGNLQEMKNAFVRMRQLSSGFLGFRNEDDGKRVEIEFAENPKLDALLELLEDMPDDRKAVVFYEFTHSGRKIHEALKTIKRDGIWLWSGTKNSAIEQRRFQENPACTIAVINNQVGAYSLDGLQDVANYAVFYESPVSVIDREQAERRLRRSGQRRKVFQYDLVVKGTLDYKILQFHREGDDLLAALRANPEKLIDGLRK